MTTTDECAALVLMPELADDEMVAEAIREGIERVLKEIWAAGGQPTGRVTGVRFMRHEPIYSEDGFLVGYHDALRIAMRSTPVELPT